MLFEPYACFHSFSYVRVIEWPLILKKADHATNDMVFPASVFGMGISLSLRLFSDHCLLVTF